MTFEKLHEGIKNDCDCNNFGKPPNPDHAFYRWGTVASPTDTQFKSNHELKIEPGKPLKSCKDHCHYRGVSMYQILNDLETKKQELRYSYHLKPIEERKFMYFLKVKNNAGLVLYQDNSDHCELLKCDDFSLDCIEILDIFDRSEPI